MNHINDFLGRGSPARDTPLPVQLPESTGQRDPAPKSSEIKVSKNCSIKD